ncbi:MAG: alpha/beta hydrolase [Sulfolobaceae archaeon]|nr:alpha/beta hydrolase [Sulfolobaceae archaeon]
MLEDKFVDIKGIKIHYLEKGNGKPYLLFHGARFNARTWEETGTIDAIAESGFRAISVDFPGFGKSQSGNYDDLGEFIKDFADTMGLGKVIVMGASMGGEAAVSFSVNNPDRLLGAVYVGAVGVSAYESKLKNLDGKPILLIWGKRDNVSPISNANLILKYVKTAKLVHVGVNHACYLDDPQGFNKEIKEFLKGIK